MKKTITIVLLCLVGITSANAQEVTKAVKLNIFSLFASTANLAYEQKINDKKSWQIAAFYTGASIVDTKLSGFGVVPEFRFYLSESQDAIAGFYAAPYAAFSNLTFSLDDDITIAEADLTSFSGGIKLGKQWVGGSVPIDLFIGGGFGSSSITVNEGQEDDLDFGSFSGSGGTFTIGLRVGLGF